MELWGNTTAFTARGSVTPQALSRIVPGGYVNSMALRVVSAAGRGPRETKVSARALAGASE